MASNQRISDLPRVAASELTNGLMLAAMTEAAQSRFATLEDLVPMVDIRRHGVRIGASDNSVRINAALAEGRATGRRVLISNFAPSSGLTTIPVEQPLDMSAVDVACERGAVLQPTVACASPCVMVDPPLVQGGMFGYPYLQHVSGLHLDGSVTGNGKVGCSVGNLVDASAYTRLSRFVIRGFSGGGGIGLEVLNGVGNLYEHGLLLGSNENLVLSGADAVTPTAQTFRGVVISQGLSSTTGGAVVKAGWNTVFDRCVFENNRARGLYVSGTASRRVDILTLTNGCWFENNWYGDGAQATKYHLESTDSGVIALYRIGVRTTRFSSGLHSIKLQGAHDYALEQNTYGAFQAADVLIDDGSIGSIRDWDTDSTYATVVTFAGTGTVRASDAS